MPRKKTTIDKKFKAIEAIENNELINSNEKTKEIIEEPAELIKEINQEPAELIKEIVKQPTELIKEVKIKKTKEIEIVKEVVKVESLSAKDNFEKQISKKPYKIYQNGILVCNYNEFLKIHLADKYFEINNKKYVYTGIEIKYA